MYILGLNAYHGDCSACLFEDNKIIAAIEEERITRIKHAAGFPINSIKFCLEYAKIDLNQIDYIAINRNPNLRIINKILYALKNILKTKNFFERIKNFKKINSLDAEFKKYFDVNVAKKIVLVDHHLSHAASSVYMSKFNDCNFVTIDGFGDFVSTTIGFYKDNKISKIKEVQFPHSLGLFYTAITQFLGFKKYGDEYKVMGLSSYGKPSFYNEINQLVKFDEEKLFKLNLKYFKHHDEGIEMSWVEGEPKLGNVYSNKLIELIGNERMKDEKITQTHMDIAASAQQVFEEIVIKILNKLYEINQCENISLSGGCAMNSVMNGKILKKTKYKKIYINHSPADSGGGIGAAIITLKKTNNNRLNINDNPYLGPNFSNDKIEKILDHYSDEFSKKNILFQKINKDEELFEKIAINLSEKKVIGLFQGRMEFGARALGNRSIICDPRNPNIKELLNEKIKNREQFRPFAPSILIDDLNDWFEISNQVPFMSEVYKIKKDKANFVPGVVHVDGTCRLQTVSNGYNENYYNIIKNFKKITSVPMILNTSFNENEPIVCRPEEAIDCFLRTKMDNLFIENYLIHRL